MLPETVRNYIHAHQSEAVETLSKLIGFPSVATPQPQDGFPYGKPAADALCRATRGAPGRPVQWAG